MNDRKLFAASLGLLAFLCTGSLASAAETAVSTSGYQSISQYLPDGMTTQARKLKSRSADSTLPSSYDPRGTEDWLTTVKNQGETGCCWAFSTLDVSAISARKSGLEDSGFDLSVWQLVYFNANRVTDPLGLTTGDYNGLSADSDAVTAGGNSLLASMTLAQGISPALEETASFADFLTAWNSGNGDITLSSDKAYQGLRLEEAAYLLPSDITAMKQAILEYGAGSVSYYADAHSDSTYWNETTYGLYVDSDAYSANHAVTVVGWDDSFSRYNFGSTVPEKDGAWLIKNTWGDEWGDGGYFWISYYDATLLENTVQFLSLTTLDEDEHLYQYDGTANVSVLPYFYTADIDYDSLPWDFDYSTLPHCSVDGQANVFTAQSYEDLKEVSFYTFDPDVTYTINVYRGDDLDQGNPTGDTEPVATLSGTVSQQGYHSVVLDTPVSLNQGEQFSIVMTTSASGGEANVPLDNSVDYEWYYSEGSSEPGESFIQLDGVWYDLYIFKDSIGESNLRIKAVTEDSQPSITLPSIELGCDDCSGSEIYLQEEEELQLYAKTIPANQTVAFESDDPSVVSVSSDGLLRGESSGTANVTASFTYENKVFQAKVHITVEKKKAIETTPSTENNGNGSGSGTTDGSGSGTTDGSGSGTTDGSGSGTTDGSGSGTADGSGSGTADGSGSGTADGSGSGTADGSGSGTADGSGSGATDGSGSDAADGSGTTTNGSDASTTDSSGSTGDSKETGSGSLESASKPVILTPSPAAADVKVSSIKLSLESCKVAPGVAVQLETTILPANASQRSVTYTSSNTKYATVDGNGKVRTTKAGAGKTVKITATAADGSGVSAVYTIKIQKKAVTKVTFKKKVTSLTPGKKGTVKAVVSPSSKVNTSVRYASSNTAYATVNSKGQVTALKAGKGKKVTITAWSMDGTKKKASITIRIK